MTVLDTTTLACLMSLALMTNHSYATTRDMAQSMTLIELISIHKDYGTTVDVQEYWQWVTPIIKKHGGEVINVYEVTQNPDNANTADFIFVIKIQPGTSMNDLVEKLTNDPEYQKNIPHRNKLYNFNKRYGYIGHSLPLN